jgi:hypothetical protein
MRVHHMYQNLVVKNPLAGAVGDPLSVQGPFRGGQVLDQFDAVALGEAHGPRVDDLPVLVDQPGGVVPWELLVSVEGVFGDRRVGLRIGYPPMNLDPGWQQPAPGQDTSSPTT